MKSLSPEADFFCVLLYYQKSIFYGICVVFFIFS